MMRTTTSFDKLNRLTGITSLHAQSALLASFSCLGRRVSKKVWSNAEGTGSPDVDLRFAYDNWNLIAVLGPDFSPILSFTWGTDLSGTLQGAGGVGGLLSVTMHTGPSAGTYFCCYDGNGNVTALVSASDASVAARYEYGPFGEVLRADGPACEMNPFRFSTKYQDDETDLLYYGYRYYNASTGRWLSRDPIEEKGFQLAAQINGDGGLNPFCFVGNDPVAFIDYLGLEPYQSCVVRLSTAISYGKKIREWEERIWPFRVKKELRRLTGIKCFFRCYHSDRENCYQIKCKNGPGRRPCDRDHGVDVLVTLRSSDEKHSVALCDSILLEVIAKKITDGSRVRNYSQPTLN